MGTKGQVGVTRRAVLVAAGVMPLATCGIRFESDAPSFLPTPSPDPAGPPILAERVRVADVLAALPGAPAALQERLRPVHTAQLGALDRALGALDPPVSPTDGTSPPVGATGAPNSAGPSGTSGLAGLSAAESAALDAQGLADLDAIVPRAARLVVASHAQRLVLLELVADAGARIPATPRLPWHAASADIARGLVGDLRSAAYGLEVAAAHLDGGRRRIVLACLGVFRDAETHLGPLVPDLAPRPLGYALPRPVATAEDALALTTGLLERFVGGCLATATPTAVARRDADRSGRSETSEAAASTSGPDGVTGGAAGARTDGGPGAGPDATPGLVTDGRGAPPLTTPADAATLVRLTRIAELTRLRCGGPLRPLPGLAHPPAAVPPTSPLSPASPASPPAP